MLSRPWEANDASEVDSGCAMNRPLEGDMGRSVFVMYSGVARTR